MECLPRSTPVPKLLEPEGTFEGQQGMRELLIEVAQMSNEGYGCSQIHKNTMCVLKMVPNWQGYLIRSPNLPSPDPAHKTK